MYCEGYIYVWLKLKDFWCFRGFNVDDLDYEIGIVFNDNCLFKIFNWKNGFYVYIIGVWDVIWKFLEYIKDDWN